MLDPRRGLWIRSTCCHYACLLSIPWYGQLVTLSEQVISEHHTELSNVRWLCPTAYSCPLYSRPDVLTGRDCYWPHLGASCTCVCPSGPSWPHLASTCPAPPLSTLPGLSGQPLARAVVLRLMRWVGRCLRSVLSEVSGLFDIRRHNANNSVKFIGRVVCIISLDGIHITHPWWNTGLCDVTSNSCFNCFGL